MFIGAHDRYKSRAINLNRSDVTSSTKLKIPGLYLNVYDPYTIQVNIKFRPQIT